MIRNDVAQQEVHLNTHLQAKAIRLTAGKEFTLCSIYLLPQRRIEGADLANIVQQLTGTYMPLGDLNVHHISGGQQILIVKEK